MGNTADVVSQIIEHIHAEAPPVFLRALPVRAEGVDVWGSGLFDVLNKEGKTVFAEMAQSGSAPSKIVKELGLVQIQDEGAIKKVIDEVIAANSAQVAQYKAGKVQLFGFFVGQSMKAMQGKGNPEMINKILKETLG